MKATATLIAAVTLFCFCAWHAHAGTSATVQPATARVGMAPWRSQRGKTHKRETKYDHRRTLDHL